MMAAPASGPVHQAAVMEIDDDEIGEYLPEEEEWEEEEWDEEEGEYGDALDDEDFEEESDEE